MTKHKNDDQDQLAPDYVGTTDATTALEQTQEQIIDELRKELAESQAALAEANDKMLRFRADADNARRRSILDVENANKYSIEKIARDLLSVVDSLEKGLEIMSNAETEQEHLIHMQQGMELTHKLLLDLLANYNIRPINPLGEAFDPKLHEALTTQPTADIDPNKVLTVVQKGFLIHDRILRPARVVVSRAP